MVHGEAVGEAIGEGVRGGGAHCRGEMGGRESVMSISESKARSS